MLRPFIKIDTEIQSLIKLAHITKRPTNTCDYCSYHR